MNFYPKTVNYINQRPSLKHAVLFLDKTLPLFVTLTFYAATFLLALQKDRRIIPYLAVPLATYIIVSYLRKRLNSTRPFEALNFTPLRHHCRGYSCPSRHASSAAVIALATYYIYPSLGIILFLISLLIAGSRVLTGVHYIKDVIIGLLLGYGFGLVGCWIFSLII